MHRGIGPDTIGTGISWTGWWAKGWNDAAMGMLQVLASSASFGTAYVVILANLGALLPAMLARKLKNN